MRKLILKWLFNYTTPQYFEAIQWYKNIKWDTEDKNDNRSVCWKEINGFQIMKSFYTKIDTSPSWSLYNRNNPLDRGEAIRDYNTLILRIHDIIHFGIIMPKDK